MLEFTEATLSDIDPLRTLEQAVVSAERPFNEAIKAGQPQYYDMEDLVQSDRSLLLVAKSRGLIVGTGYVQLRSSKDCYIHDQHAYLGFMYVDPGWRGAGVNQGIVNRLLAWAVDQGATYAYLDVYCDNQPAIRAYEKVGFKASTLSMQLALVSDS
jgi:ribosomal protein S18 acetylase RimI-like enzyme